MQAVYVYLGESEGLQSNKHITFEKLFARSI